MLVDVDDGAPLDDVLLVEELVDEPGPLDVEDEPLVDEDVGPDVVVCEAPAPPPLSASSQATQHPERDSATRIRSRIPRIRRPHER